MKNKQVNIKIATVKDSGILAQIGSRTFFETYFNQNDKANIDSYIKKTFNKKRINSEIKNKSSIFLVVSSNDSVIGYIKLRSNKKPKGLNKKAIEIERMYLVKEFIGRGIGKIIMKKCLNIARDKNYETLWLGVWKRNTSAINFYKKFGFQEFGFHKFKFGNKQHNDLLFKKEL